MRRLRGDAGRWRHTVAALRLASGAWRSARVRLLAGHLHRGAHQVDILAVHVIHVVLTTRRVVTIETTHWTIHFLRNVNKSIFFCSRSENILEGLNCVRACPRRVTTHLDVWVIWEPALDERQPTWMFGWYESLPSTSVTYFFFQSLLSGLLLFLYNTPWGKKVTKYSLTYNADYNYLSVIYSCNAG